MSDEGIDVFQERKSKVAGDKPVAASTQSDKGPSASSKMNKTPSGKAVFCVLGVIALAWALWPLFASSTNEATQRHQILNPAQSMLPASAPISRESDETAKKLLQAFEKTEANLAVTSQRISELHTENQAVAVAVREIQAKIALFEQRLTERAAHEPAATPTKVVRPAASATVINTKGSDKRPGKATDYAINTIYSDQAWLEAKDRTYIVQVGDVIDGLKVLKINAADRTVLTNAGLIR